MFDGAKHVGGGKNQDQGLVSGMAVDACQVKLPMVKYIMQQDLLFDEQSEAIMTITTIIPRLGLCPASASSRLFPLFNYVCARWVVQALVCRDVPIMWRPISIRSGSAPDHQPTFTRADIIQAIIVFQGLNHR